MSLGFDPDQFLNADLKPFIQDVGISKRLVFKNVSRSNNPDGTQEENSDNSETYGVVISNPDMDSETLKRLFPNGKTSEEVVKFFYIDTDISFEVKDGHELDIYTRDGVFIGTYRIKFVFTNRIIDPMRIGYALSSK